MPDDSCSVIHELEQPQGIFLSINHRVEKEIQEVAEDASLLLEDPCNRKDFYVYLFRNPLDDNNIFYMGKGTGDRAEQLKTRNDKTKAVIDAISKEFSKTNRPIEDIIEILRENLEAV